MLGISSSLLPPSHNSLTPLLNANPRPARPRSPDCASAGPARGGPAHAPARAGTAHLSRGKAATRHRRPGARLSPASAGRERTWPPFSPPTPPHPRPPRVISPEPRGQRRTSAGGPDTTILHGGKRGRARRALTWAAAAAARDSGPKRALTKDGGGERAEQSLGNAFFSPPLNNESRHWAGATGSARANGEPRVRQRGRQRVRRARAAPPGRVVRPCRLCWDVVIPQNHGVTE